MRLTNPLPIIRQFLLGWISKSILSTSTAPSNSSTLPATTSVSSSSGASQPPAASSESESAAPLPQPASTCSASDASSSETVESSVNFSLILKAASLVANVLPLLSSLIQQVQQDLAGVAGTSKLQAVLASVGTVMSKIESDVEVVATAKSLIEPLINELVAAFKLNSVGAFAAGSAPAASAPAPAASSVAAAATGAAPPVAA